MTPDALGIEDGYENTARVWQPIPARTRAAIRAAMATDDPEGEAPAVDLVRVIRSGGTPAVDGPHDLMLEDGSVLSVDGRLPPDLPPGYHDLRPLDGRAPTRLIVSPGRCHLPAESRLWGWSVQLYALRSTRSWGIGDLADLREFARWSARELGAQALVVNPLNAPAPTLPQETSPYFPTSRRFRNPLYLRIEEVPSASEAGLDLERLAAVGRALTAERRIDRDAVFRLKMGALEQLWSRRPEPARFARYRAEQGRALTEFATFCALAEQYGASWRRWPSEYHQPHAPAVTRFVETARDRVGFHEGLQWLLDEQLARVANELRPILDFPIGFDPDGADAWVWQDLLAAGMRVGAPPDTYNTGGQDWGFPPFVPGRLRIAKYEPFIATLRACLRHAGGLRIDHVPGLFRLFWIPSGMRPAEGGYVRYPASELLGIIALESQRARAPVIGEDLGTVAPGIREQLAAHQILSTRLLWFETEPPARYPALSLAAVTTHDLPTIGGLWSGADLREQVELRLVPDESANRALRGRLQAITALPENAALEDVVLGAHRALAQAPSRLATATLDDALGVVERPNMPGAASGQRANWSIALPVLLEAVTRHPLVRAVGECLRRGGSHDAAPDAPGELG